MNDPASLLPAVLVGAACGAVFFGGLWWTLRRGLQSPHAGLWFLGSFWLRTGLVIGGFVWTGEGDWRRLMAALLGFFGARVATQIIGGMQRSVATHAARGEGR